MTVHDLPKLKHGDVLHHKYLKNADGTPSRCRVTGKPQAYKRDPYAVRLSVKHGLRDSFYLTKDNCEEWDD